MALLACWHLNLTYRQFTLFESWDILGHFLTLIIPTSSESCGVRRESDPLCECCRQGMHTLQYFPFGYLQRVWASRGKDLFITLHYTMENPDDESFLKQIVHERGCGCSLRRKRQKWGMRSIGMECDIIQLARPATVPRTSMMSRYLVEGPVNWSLK